MRRLLVMLSLVGLLSCNNESVKETPRVIFYKAEWCGYCKKYQPVMEKFAAKYNFKFETVDIDATADKEKLVGRDIGGVPTIEIRSENGLVYFGNMNQELLDAAQ